jgi:hypothetical protein
MAVYKKTLIEDLKDAGHSDQGARKKVKGQVWNQTRERTQEVCRLCALQAKDSRNLIWINKGFEPRTFKIA